MSEWYLTHSRRLVCKLDIQCTLFLSSDCCKATVHIHLMPSYICMGFCCIPLCVLENGSPMQSVSQIYHPIDWLEINEWMSPLCIYLLCYSCHVTHQGVYYTWLLHVKRCPNTQIKHPFLLYPSTTTVLHLSSRV